MGHEYSIQAITRCPTWRRISDVTLYCRKRSHFWGHFIDNILNDWFMSVTNLLTVYLFLYFRTFHYVRNLRSPAFQKYN